MISSRRVHERRSRCGRGRWPGVGTGQRLDWVVALGLGQACLWAGSEAGPEAGKKEDRRRGRLRVQRSPVRRLWMS